MNTKMHTLLGLLIGTVGTLGGIQPANADDCADLTFVERDFEVVNRSEDVVTLFRGGQVNVRLRDHNTVAEVAESFVECNRTVLGVGASYLLASTIQYLPEIRGQRRELSRVFLAQELDGIPVEARGVQLVFADDSLIEMRSNLLVGLEGLPHGQVTESDAVQTSSDALGLEQPQDSPRASLTIALIDDEPTLLWKVEHRGSHRFDGFVDAITGSFVRSVDHHQNAVAGHGHGKVVSSTTTQNIGFTKIDIFATNNPSTLLTSTVADANGNYTVDVPYNPDKADLTVRAKLSGPFADVSSASTHIFGPKTAVALQASSYQDTVDIDWRNFDESPNYGQTNAYYNVIRAHEFFNERESSDVYTDDVLAVSGLDYPMPVHVDDPSMFSQVLGCHGQWQGKEKGIALAGPSTLKADMETSCNDLALNDCVISHEYGHAVVDFIRGEYPMPQGIEDPMFEGAAMGEAFADHIASMVSPQCPGTDNELKVDRHWQTNDPLDKGAHVNNKIVAGFLWRVRQSVLPNQGDRIFMQALRCQPSMATNNDQSLLENFVECMIAEDAILHGAGGATGPNLEAICDAANTHAIRPEVCFHHTEDPIVIIDIPDSYYNPNPVPPAWLYIPGMSVWTNKKTLGNTLFARVRVANCRDGDSLTTQLRYKKTTDANWTTFPQYVLMPGEMDTYVVLLDYDTMDNAAYQIRADTTCIFGDPVLGNSRNSDSFDRVVRDDKYYEVTIINHVTLPHNLEITDPDTDGAIHMHPGGILDCDGNSIVGRFNWPSGIAVWGENADGSSVRNCGFGAFNSGIWYSKSTAIQISDNTFGFFFSRENPEYGKAPRTLQVIRVAGGGLVSVHDNTITGAFSADKDSLAINVGGMKGKSFVARNEISFLDNVSGIRANNTSDMEVSDNRLDHIDSAQGIRGRITAEDKALLINENTVTDIDQPALLIVADKPESYIAIRHNTLSTSGSFQPTMHIANTASAGTVRDNNIDSAVPNSGSIGINLARVSGLSIENNSVTTDFHGISVSGGKELTITGNDISSSIALYFSADSAAAGLFPPIDILVSQNDIFEADTGIHVLAADTLRIMNNSLLGCIHVWDNNGDRTQSLDIAGNEIESNLYGIRMQGGENHRVADNWVNAIGTGISVGNGYGHLFDGNTVFSQTSDGIHTIADPRSMTFVNNSLHGTRGLGLTGRAHTVYNNLFEGSLVDVTDTADDETNWFVIPGTVEGTSIHGNLPIGGNHYVNYNGASTSSQYLTPLEHSSDTGATDEYPLP